MDIISTIKHFELRSPLSLGIMSTIKNLVFEIPRLRLGTLSPHKPCLWNPLASLRETNPPWPLFLQLSTLNFEVPRLCLKTLTPLKYYFYNKECFLRNPSASPQDTNLPWALFLQFRTLSLKCLGFALGQELPAGIISTFKYFEVPRLCLGTLTPHGHYF